MVLVSGQNEVLLVLLSFLMLGNNVCFKSSNCRWAPCGTIKNRYHGLGVVKTHTFGRHVENVFYLKDFVTWQVCEMLSDISLGGVFTLLFATTTLVYVVRLIVKYMDLLKPVGFLKTH